MVPCCWQRGGPIGVARHTRRIVGWSVSASLSKEAPLSALEMAIWTRAGEDLSGLVHHSDRGSQYLSIRYTTRLEQAGIVPSVGSKGDCLFTG